MQLTLLKNTGNADFISLKAAKRIRLADIICYDPHIDKDLLEFAPLGCLFFTDFHQCIRFLHKNQKKQRYNVIRMTEERDSNHTSEFIELSIFQSMGFETETIPGVSNINRISALQQFPLTVRSHNESFWVYDGAATCNDNLQLHLIERVATTSASIVMLNPGTSAADAIGLVAQFRGEDTPVLLTLRNGESFTSTLGVLQAVTTAIQWANYHLIHVKPAINKLLHELTRHPTQHPKSMCEVYA